MDSQEDFNNLSQLDRIEYRQGEISINQGYYFINVAASIFYVTSLSWYVKWLILLTPQIFGAFIGFFMVGLFIYLCGWYVLNKNREALDNKFFDIEYKPNNKRK